MGKFFRNILMGLMASIMLVASGCGSKTEYDLKVRVNNLGTQSLTVVISRPEGIDYQKIAAMDSQFELKGSVTGPSVAEVYSNAHKLLGRFVIIGGDHGEVTIDPAHPEMIESDSKANKELSDFLKAHSEELQAAIEEQTAKEPESLLTAVLLRYYYVPDDPGATFGLLGNVTGEYAYMVSDLSELLQEFAQPEGPLREITLRAPGDTTATFSPASEGLTLYYFYTSPPSIYDSIANYFKTSPLKDVTLAAIRMMGDTTRWRYQREDVFPKGATHLWAPEGIHNSELSDVRFHRLPLLVATDSAGTQLYRAETFEAMIDSLSTQKD